MPTLDDVLIENQRLRSRVDDLEDLVRAHIGPNTGSGGADYPHPRQQVDVTEYGGGKMRLDPAGIQIVADDDNQFPAAFYIVPSFFFAEELAYSSGTPLPDRDYWSGIYGNADNSDNFISLISRNYIDNATDWFARVFTYADNGSAFAEMYAQRDGGAVAEWVVYAYPTATSSVGVVYAQNAVILPMLATSDPTGLAATDGALLYRSDTDKFRARVNGAWVNLLTSADSVGGWPLTINSGTGDITAADKQLVLYKGTGGHTVTLPASPLASDVFVVVKNFGTGNVTVDGDGADTIDGALTVVLAPYDSVTLHTESATGNWYII